MKIAVAIVVCSVVAAQQHVHQHGPKVALQPLAQQVRQLEDALSYLGQPLSDAEHRQINAAIGNPDETEAVVALESVLDTHAIALVDINPESRVKVEQGVATPELVQRGTRLFLVKVANNGNVTAELKVASPNSGDVYIPSSGSPQPEMKLTSKDASERWADISCNGSRSSPPKFSRCLLAGFPESGRRHRDERCCGRIGYLLA